MDARISTSLPQHPKTKKLARRLGPAGPLACIYLFLWAAANRSDGDLSGMSEEDIELAVDWAGDAGAFVATMVEVRFLDGQEGKYRIHDWTEHNPWAAGAEARSEKSRWAALCKQHGRREAARMMPEYAERMRAASHESATGTTWAVPDSATGTPLADSGSAPSPLPSPLPIPDQKPTPSAAPMAAAELPDPPAWIDPKAWDGFVAMRKRERHPLTPRAAELIHRKLADMRAQGVDPNDALDQSTRNGWRDVFALKPDTGATHATHPPRRESLAERVERRCREADERDARAADSRAESAGNAHVLGANGRDLRA